MANYTVDIQLALKAQAAEKKLKDIQNLVNRIDNRAESISDRFSKLLVPDKTFARIASKLKNIEGLQKRSLTVVEQRTNRLRQESGLLAGLKKNEELRNQILRQTQVKTAQRLGDLRAQTREISTQVKLRKMMEEGAGIRASYKADAQRNAPSSPIGGRANIPGSPAARRAGRAGAGRGFQSAALGVGFPLLFGGGAGSVIGGGLGSAGGFGGQILGSAIGAQLDAFAASSAKLGQALNLLTADVDEVIKATGESGTEFEQLVKGLEKVAGTEAALEVASAKLAVAVGQGGVTALKQFGDETAELGNTFSVTLTQIGVAVAELINKAGLLKFVTEGLEKRNLLTAGLKNSSDPKLKQLNEERAQLKGEGVFSRAADDPEILAIENKIIARQREIQLIKEAAIEENARIVKAEALQQKSLVSLRVAEAQLELDRSGLDITTDQGFELAKKVIEARKYERLQQAINEGSGHELAILQEQVDLFALSNQRKEKERRDAERDAKEAERARNKENQILRTINSLIISNNEIALQSVQIAHGEQVALEQQAASLFEKFRILKKNVELSTEDARVKDLQLQKLDLQKQLESNQISSRQRSLQVEKAITAEKQKQALAAIETDIGRQIQDANFRPTGDSAQDAQIALRIDQIRRQEDVTTRLTNAIKEQQITIDNPSSADAAMRAEEQRQSLQDQLDLYSQLLPQLDAAEQAQLKFNQAFEAAKPIADAVTTGLFGAVSAIVDGTKTAEEAFADFLKSIGEMLIQTAAQMIAQYIALGIAKAFAFGGSTGPDFSQFGTNTTGVSTNFIGSGLTGFAGYAEGGYVTGPTNAVVGEGGEPEYVIPSSKMNEAMGRYARGIRGGAVIPDSSGGDAGGEMGSGGSIDVTYSVERINSVDYVTAAEFERGIAQAAKRGAEMGKRGVYSDLVNKRSIRSRVGI